MRSIDVGCMQINLMHHAEAFTSLDQAFEPQANVTYAARFLNQLFVQTNSWPKAAAAYHSQTPEIAAPYVRQVMALWPLAARYAEPATPAPLTVYTAEFAARMAAEASDRAQLDAEMRTPVLAVPKGHGPTARRPLVAHARARQGVAMTATAETAKRPLL